jgi:predicted DNA-binding transcriptional regulator AlpA
MVPDLLVKLFSQRIRICHNIMLWDRVKGWFPQNEPLTVITIAYGLSLVSLFSLHIKAKLNVDYIAPRCICGTLQGCPLRVNRSSPLGCYSTSSYSCRGGLQIQTSEEKVGGLWGDSEMGSHNEEQLVGMAQSSVWHTLSRRTVQKLCQHPCNILLSKNISIWVSTDFELWVWCKSQKFRLGF